MKKMKSNWATGVFLSIFSVLFAFNSAHAAETTMVVELQKRIKNNIANIETMQQSMGEKNKKFQQEIGSIKQELVSTRNKDDRRYLAKLYFKEWSGTLMQTVQHIDQLQGAVHELIGDMESLQKSVNRVQANGFSPTSVSDVRVTANVVSGLGAMMETLKQMSPDNKELAMASRTLAYQDAVYRDSIKPNKNFNIEDQVKFLASISATLESAKKMVDRERYNLHGFINLIMQGEIEEGLANIDVNLGPIYMNLVNGQDEHIAVIDMIDSGSRTRRSSPSYIDTSNVGNWEVK